MTLGKKLAQALLTVHIGRTFNPYKPEEERVDMPLSEFQELRQLAEEALKESEEIR